MNWLLWVGIGLAWIVTAYAAALTIGHIATLQRDEGEGQVESSPFPDPPLRPERKPTMRNRIAKALYGVGIHQLPTGEPEPCSVCYEAADRVLEAISWDEAPKVAYHDVMYEEGWYEADDHTHRVIREDTP